VINITSEVKSDEVIIKEFFSGLSDELMSKDLAVLRYGLIDHLSDAVPNVDWVKKAYREVHGKKLDEDTLAIRSQKDAMYFADSMKYSGGKFTPMSTIEENDATLGVYTAKLAFDNRITTYRVHIKGIDISSKEVRGRKNTIICYDMREVVAIADKEGEKIEGLDDARRRINNSDRLTNMIKKDSALQILGDVLKSVAS